MINIQKINFIESFFQTKEIRYHKYQDSLTFFNCHIFFNKEDIFYVLYKKELEKIGIFIEVDEMDIYEIYFKLRRINEMIIEDNKSIDIIKSKFDINILDTEYDLLSRMFIVSYIDINIMFSLNNERDDCICVGNLESKSYCNEINDTILRINNIPVIENEILKSIIKLTDNNKIKYHKIMDYLNEEEKK